MRAQKTIAQSCGQVKEKGGNWWWGISGVVWGRGWRRVGEEGRHKACPYRWVEGGVKAACEGVRGQAQGLPLPEFWVGTEGAPHTGV